MSKNEDTYFIERYRQEIMNMVEISDDLQLLCKVYTLIVTYLREVCYE